MKKVLAIALVAILVASSAFATFSGSATVGVGANFDNGNYGFIGNGTNVNFDVDLTSASAEAISEGDVYASIKASLGITLKSDEDGISSDDPLGVGMNVLSGENGKYSAWLYAKIDEAKVAGNNWYVSLLGVPSVNDFAKSAIDTWTVEDEIDSDYGFKKADYDKNATYKVGYQKAPGVEVGVYDYVVGFGFRADADKANGFEPFAKYAATIYGKTPEYTLVDGLKLQAGATYAISDGSYTSDKTVNALGASAKVSYVADALSTSVASDIGYDFDAKEFGADVAANVTYDFLGFDAYYATKAANSGTVTNGKYDDGAKVENLLSAQVVTDLNSFDIPVKVTVAGKDLVNTQDTSLKVEVKIADVKLTPSIGYVFDSGKFSTGLDAEYKVDAFTAKAGIKAETYFNENDLILKASASIETKALIPGATLKLAWSDANDLLKRVDDHEEVYGKIVASCKIAF